LDRTHTADTPTAPPVAPALLYTLASQTEVLRNAYKVRAAGTQFMHTYRVRLALRLSDASNC
jgi:hypothetical protein